MELESIALDHSAKLTVRGDLMDNSAEPAEFKWSF